MSPLRRDGHSTKGNRMTTETTETFTVLCNMWVQGACFVRVRLPATGPQDAIDRAARWAQMHRSEAIGSAHERRTTGKCSWIVVEPEPSGPVDVDLTTP